MQQQGHDKMQVRGNNVGGRWKEKEACCTDGQSTLSESGRHATGGSLAGVRRVCTCVWGKAFFVWYSSPQF